MAQNENGNGYGYENSNSNEGVYGNYGSGYGSGYGEGGVYGANTFLDLMDILWKRKLGMLMVFLIIIGTTIFITFTQTPVFQVSASMMVKYGREFTYHAIDPKGEGDIRPSLRFNADEIIATMLEVFKSKRVIEPTLKKLGLGKLFPKLSEKKDQDDAMRIAIARFKGSLNVRHVKGSNVIRIGFQHSDPEPVVEALTILTQEFKNRHIEIFKNPKTAFLEKQANDALQKFIDSQNAVKAFKKENNIFNFENQERILNNELSDTRIILAKNIALRENYTQQLATFQERLRNTPEISITFEVSGDTENSNVHRARLLELQLQEKDLLRRYHEDNRLIRQVRDQIKIIEGSIAGPAPSNHQESSHSSKSYAYNQLEARINATAGALAGSHAQTASLTETVRNLEKRLAEITDKASDLKKLQILAKAAQKSYTKIIDNLEENRMLDMLDQEKIISIVDIESPIIPLNPIKPRKRINLMVGFILAAASAFAYALLFEYSSLRKSARTEI